MSSSIERLITLQRKMYEQPGNDTIAKSFTQLWRRLGKPGRNPLINPCPGDLVLVRPDKYHILSKSFFRQVLDCYCILSIEKNQYDHIHYFHFYAHNTSKHRGLISIEDWRIHNSNDEAIVIRHGGKVFECNSI